MNANERDRLFAAAPDMLAALKKVVEDFDGPTSTLRQARAAIAKAELGFVSGLEHGRKPGDVP
jgi:hypothetical protein